MLSRKVLNVILETQQISTDKLFSHVYFIELYNLYNRLTTNKLTLNTKKRKVIVIHKLVYLIMKQTEVLSWNVRTILNI